MITLKSEIIKDKLIRHYAEDEQGNKYYIKQVETGVEYGEAVDIIPCKYSYVATDKKIDENEYFTDKEFVNAIDSEQF